MTTRGGKEIKRVFENELPAADVILYVYVYNRLANQRKHLIPACSDSRRLWIYIEYASVE